MTNLDSIINKEQLDCPHVHFVVVTGSKDNILKSQCLSLNVKGELVEIAKYYSIYSKFKDASRNVEFAVSSGITHSILLEING